MENTLKKRVMRRVYAVWLVRKTGPLVAETAGISLAGFWGMQYISPVHVVVNAIAAADGFRAFFIFFVRSFQHLSVPSQFAMVVSAMLAAVILRNMWFHAVQLGRLRNGFSANG